jgi:hypothetical protein
MSTLQPELLRDLQNFKEYELCAASVGTILDIYRAAQTDSGLKMKYDHTDGFVTELLLGLCSNELHSSLRPPFISCLGYIALATGYQLAIWILSWICLGEKQSYYCTGEMVRLITGII